MTFSLLGRCPRTGMLGMVIASSSLAVAARCAHARAAVGVVATQNITDPALGFKGLDLLADGLEAPQALERLKTQTAHIEYRQLALLDSQGRTAAFSGAKTLGVHAVEVGKDAVAAGNLLANTHVPRSMLTSFHEREALDLGDRLLDSLNAGLVAGGEASPVHSAGLILVHDVQWPVTDLRVDWCDEDPIAELTAVWRRWKPQMRQYTIRALNPVDAPSYGVAGDP